VGELRFRIESPPPLGNARIDFQLPGGPVHRFRVPARSTIEVTMPVCSRGPWTADFTSEVRGFVGDRGVSVRSTVPRFVPRKGACAGKPAPPRQTVVRRAPDQTA
jgi:hypothetical protein